MSSILKYNRFLIVVFIMLCSGLLIACPPSCGPCEYWDDDIDQCVSCEDDGNCCDQTCLMAGQDCCNGQVYYTSTWGCCNGVTYYKSTHGCCSGYLYNKSTHGCCGNYIYNLSTHICCGTGQWPKSGGYDDCCDGQGYNSTTHGCCSDPVYGDLLYDRSTHGCCDGMKYILSSQGCCDGVRYEQDEEGCCDGELYDNSEDGCCNDELYDLSTEDCCSGVKIDLSTHECCGGYPITKCDSDECLECDGAGNCVSKCDVCELCNGEGDCVPFEDAQEWSGGGVVSISPNPEFLQSIENTINKIPGVSIEIGDASISATTRYKDCCSLDNGVIEDGLLDSSGSVNLVFEIKDKLIWPPLGTILNKKEFWYPFGCIEVDLSGGVYIKSDVTASFTGGYINNECVPEECGKYLFSIDSGVGIEGRFDAIVCNDTWWSDPTCTGMSVGVTFTGEGWPLRLKGDLGVNLDGCNEGVSGKICVIVAINPIFYARIIVNNREYTASYDVGPIVKFDYCYPSDDESENEI